MDPYLTYASRRYVAPTRFSRDDYDSDEGYPLPEPEDPRFCTILSENIEFDVEVDKIARASPSIARSLASTSRRGLGLNFGTADHLQCFLKYVHTGIYDPADISQRYKDKFATVYGQLSFYTFCQQTECKPLCDIVRVGIQSALDVLAWAPLPDRHDAVDMDGYDGTLLIALFDGGARYYPKLANEDPVKYSLLRYLNRIWQAYGPMFREDRVDSYMQMDCPELWRDMKAYKEKVPVDIYESWAPKYSREIPKTSWLSSLFTQK